MYIHFATSNRKDALCYLQDVLPHKKITDTPDSAGPLLDFVQQGIVRVQDPKMHGSRIHVMPGDNYVESKELRQKIVDACRIFTDETDGKETS